MSGLKRTFIILFVTFVACGRSVFINYLAMDGMKDRNGQDFSLENTSLSGVSLNSDRYEPDSDSAQITIKAEKNILQI